MSVASHTKTILSSYRDNMSGEESLEFLTLMFEEDWDIDEEQGSEDILSKYFIIKGGIDCKRFKAWFSPQDIKVKGNVMFTLKYQEGSLLVMAETKANGWFSFSSTTKIARIILKILEKTKEIKVSLQ